jgi:exonuclease III
MKTTPTENADLEQLAEGIEMAQTRTLVEQLTDHCFWRAVLAEAKLTGRRADYLNSERDFAENATSPQVIVNLRDQSECSLGTYLIHLGTGEMERQ